LDVSRYILKSSVNPQDILATIDEVSAELKELQIHRSMVEIPHDNPDENLVIIDFLNLVIKGVVSAPEIIAQKMQLFNFSDTIPAYLQVYTAFQKNKARVDLLYKISSICNSIIKDFSKGVCFVSYDDFLVVILQTRKKEQAEELAFRLQASAKQYFDTTLASKCTEINVHKWDLYESYASQKHELGKFFFDTSIQTQHRQLIPSTEFASYEKLSSTLGIIKNMMVQSSVVSENEAKKVFAGAIEFVMVMYDLKLKDVLTQTEKENILAIFSSIPTFEEVSRLTLEIIKRCYRLGEEKGYCEYNDELTDSMVRYIHKNCNSKISSKDVAKHVCFSIDYTCKYFKKKTRTNLMDYILKLKVYKSRQELLDGLSVSAVAEKYGFSSDGHFVKTFKRYQSITPGAFVKLHSSNQCIRLMNPVQAN